MRLTRETSPSSSKPIVGGSRDGVATLFVETKKTAGHAGTLARRLQGKVKPGFRTAMKHRAMAKQAPDEVVSWLDEVVADGEGVIVVRTASGLHRLSVKSLDHGTETGPSTPAMDPDVAEAVSRAQARSRETAASILEQSDMLTGENIAQRMGMSRQAVHKAAIANKLLALEGAKRGLRYPEWQLDDTGVRCKGLQEVLDLVGNGWEAWRFLAASGDGVSNRERLRSGDVEGLLARARLWNSTHFG